MYQNNYCILPSCLPFLFYFLDFFGGQTSILLANALYFKGIWEKSFDEQNTQPRCFYLANNECYMTPMMDTVNVFKYDEVRELDAQVVELPYTVRAVIRISK